MAPAPTEVAEFLIKISGRPITGDIYFRYKFVLVFLTVIIFDSLVLMIIKWHDVRLRLFAFEDILINAYILFTYIYFALYPKETTNLIDIVKRKNFFTDYEVTSRQTDLLKNGNDVKQRTMKILLSTVVVYHSCNCFLPGIIGTLQILKNPDFSYDTIDELPLAFESLYPFQFMKNSLYPYYTIITIQNICIVGEAIVFGVWSLLAILAYVTVETEMEILIESLKNIDVAINKKRIKQSVMDVVPFGGYVTIPRTLDDEAQGSESIDFNTERDVTFTRESEAVLRKFIKDFVSHHQSIIRVVKEVHKSTNFLTFMLNQIVCCQVCVSLYSSFSLKGTFFKCRSFVTAFSVLGNFGLFCLYGQCLIDKSNDLRFELMSCSWLNKPEWFKKSLCIIMARCSTPLQIKPLGLYILNMQNFCKVVNASYSYYNFLHKFKKD